MIIGITGSSGAGKSTVCEMIEKTYNSKTITADKIARKLSEKGTEYLNEIIQRFGNNVLTENGDLNRRKLANIIYSSKQKRQELNQITFKYIKKEIEKEILKSDIGINPNNDGKVIRLNFPELNEERRKELVKDIRKLAEEAKVAIRSIRRDAMDEAKEMQKKSEITEDDLKNEENEIQKLTDKKVEEIDNMLANKEKEIMSI